MKYGVHGVGRRVLTYIYIYGTTSMGYHQKNCLVKDLAIIRRELAVLVLVPVLLASTSEYSTTWYLLVLLVVPCKSKGYR